MRVVSARLSIYPVEDAELRRLIETAADPELKKAYGEMLLGCETEPQDRLWYAAWYIEPKDAPGEVAGDLCFKGPAADGAVEIGYGLREGFCGRGYMTEAVRAMAEWALSQNGVKRVEAETEPNNAASQRVLARAGFVPTGTVGEEGPRFVYGR
jgi:RimJ/RimL family protein N-acetyltransferase